MYILKISNKAFVRLEDNSDIIIVQEPERATKIEAIGDAMRQAGQINKDWEANVVQIIRVG